MATNAIRGTIGGSSRKRGSRLQMLKVLERVEQAVGVVNTDSGNQAFLDQGKGNAVDGREYIGIFHANGGEIVDVEKTAIVDFIGCNPPKTEAIRLIVEETFQVVETVGVAFAAVDFRQNLIQGGFEDCTAINQACDPALDNFLFPLTFPYLGQVGILPRRQVGQGGEYALEFEQVIVTGWELVFYFRKNLFEEQRPGAWGQGIKDALSVEGKRACFVGGADHLAFQDEAKLIGQERQQDFVGKLGLGRVPIDIEVAGEVRTGAVFEHVPPPEIRRMGDAHVVGDDVDNQPHGKPLQAFGKG